MVLCVHMHVYGDLLMLVFKWPWGGGECGVRRK